MDKHVARIVDILGEQRKFAGPQATAVRVDLNASLAEVLKLEAAWPLCLFPKSELYQPIYGAWPLCSMFAPMSKSQPAEVNWMACSFHLRIGYGEGDVADPIQIGLSPDLFGQFVQLGHGRGFCRFAG